MEREKYRAWAEIDLDALLGNHRAVKARLSPGGKICAVVKADAYGHGAVSVAHCLEDETDFLAVAMAEEAYELREAGIRKPILVLGAVPAAHVAGLVKRDVRLTLVSYEQGRTIAREARGTGRKAKVHIALDTGMGRIGFLPGETAAEQIAKLSKLDELEIEGIFSHFAAADEPDPSFAFSQRDRFESFLKLLAARGVRAPIAHLYNSAAVCRMDARFDMAREGLVLYGLSPSKEMQNDLPEEIRPVMTLKTRVAQVKTLPAGMPVSYGSTFVTKKKTRIATVSVGYGDGLPRGLSNCGELLVRGNRARILGRVCMDQLMLDVTDIPGVRAGDEAIVFGRCGGIELSCAEQAEKCGTISYELLCNVNRRVPRVYIKNGRIVSVSSILPEE